MSTEPPAVKSSVLLKAETVINGARRKDYGHALDNHSTTAALWNAYLSRITGQPIKMSPEDVCVLNILQKVSRGGHSMTEDTMVDIAGYAGNIEMIRDERTRRANSDQVVDTSRTQ